MPYQGVPDGLYLVKRRSEAKGVDHFGILDVGNRLGYPQASQPVVLHQVPPAVRADWLQNTAGPWTILGRILDEAGAINRINEAARNPRYDVLGNNCKHFARYVATGKRESPQLQGVVAGVGLVGLIVYVGTRRAA